MNFGELKAEALRMLDEELASPLPQYFTEQDIEDALNDGYEEMCEYAEPVEALYHLTLSVGVRYYNLFSLETVPANRLAIHIDEFGDATSRDSGALDYAERFRFMTVGFSPGFGAAPILTILSVFNPTLNKFIDPTTFTRLDAQFPGWQKVQGTPTEWFFRGPWTLGLDRLPVAAQELIIRHTTVPARMSADDEIPAFDAEFHRGLIDYLMAEFCAIEDELQLSQEYRAAYYAKREALLEHTEQRHQLAQRGVIGGYNTEGQYPPRSSSPILGEGHR